MINEGPDVPFGGLPIPALDLAKPETTGQVMKIIVDLPLTGTDTSVPPDPAHPPGDHAPGAGRADPPGIAQRTEF